ncbi:MAG: alkane 1-monooxygenase [Saprospirales bacterium]|nr:alkane 1-monooxygenase [Saprospirales bacterium]
MLRDLKYLIAYIAPLSTLIAILWQGAWSYSTVVVAFVLIPIGEQLLGGSPKNLTPEEEGKKARTFFFDLLLYLNLPILYGLVFLFLKTVTTASLQTWEVVGLTLSTSIIVGTIGINVAHELGHRRKKFEQWLSKLMLTTALYTHFFIEHNRGHHVWVATDKDPASAPAGESLYHFWWRSISGSYLHAWQLEADRLKRKGRSPLSPSNQMIWLQLMQLLYLAAVWYLFGWTGLFFAVAIALGGALLLETVNYIEHYGLRRKKLPNGQYEKVKPWHSWNSDHELGRIFLYELTRHSDHHYKATRKYQVLRHFDESPQLPLGYPASMLLALIPPLWFRTMHERLKNWNQQQAVA